MTTRTRKLLPHTKRTSTIIIHMMQACPQLTDATVTEALIRGGYTEVSARIMAGWFRARVNENNPPS